MMKFYLIGNIVAVVLVLAALPNYLKKANLTIGVLVIYLAVIATSWFGLIVTAATFAEDTKWGRKAITHFRHFEKE